jgi:hypothetical protein
VVYTFVSEAGRFYLDHFRTTTYENISAIHVCIQKTSVRYGSGDYEDPPEYRDDIPGEFYYVWYSPAGSRGEFKSGDGAFPTLEEAITHIEKSVDGLQWHFQRQ